MIERLRRGAQSGLSYILIGVLIVFFAVFFGVPADGCMAGDGARVQMASVDGDDLYTDDVNPIFFRYFGGQRGPRGDEETTLAQSQALQIVITIHLLAQKAEEAGLRVSDDEFREYIADPHRNIEFLTTYGSTGEWHGPGYDQYVRNRLNTPLPSYEDFKRRELLARKYLSMLEMQVQVTPEELEQLYRAQNTEIDLEYVRLDRDTIIDTVGFDDDDLDDFVADDDNRQRIEDYYETHRDDFTEPEELKVSQIRIPKEADMDHEQALAQYEDARQRVVEQREDFASVASDVQDGFDGSLGWRTEDTLDSDLFDALEEAEVGAVEEVETDMEYILAKLDDRRQEEVAALEDVEREIAEQLLRDDIFDEYGSAIAESIHQKLADGLTFEEALEQGEQQAREAERDTVANIWAELGAESTGPFALEEEQTSSMSQFDMATRPWDEIPGLGQDRELATNVFNLTEDEPLVDEVVEINDSQAVIRLVDRQEPDDEIPDDELAELETQVRAEKSHELLGPWQGLFQSPGFFFDQLFEEGGYLYTIFHQGVEDGEVRLYDRHSQAAARLQEAVERRDARGDDDRADIDQL